jgi:hypothetical protein
VPTGGIFLLADCRDPTAFKVAFNRSYFVKNDEAQTTYFLLPHPNSWAYISIMLNLASRLRSGFIAQPLVSAGSFWEHGTFNRRQFRVQYRMVR